MSRRLSSGSGFSGFKSWKIISLVLFGTLLLGSRAAQTKEVMTDYLESTNYLDYEHPLVQKTLAAVIKEAETPEEKIESIFYFVRDDIAFGWTPRIYEMKASDVLTAGVGFANTKGTLFVALLRAAGIPARQRFYRIRDHVIRGFISRPNHQLDYSYTEVFLNDKWIKTDAYTVDMPLYLRSIQKLKDKKKDYGYGVLLDGSVTWDPHEHRFIQFYGHQSRLVLEHHGVFKDVEDFYAKLHGNDRIPKYAPKVIIRQYIARVQNRVRRVRQDNPQVR